MNKVFGIAAIGLAVGMSGNLGARAATPASVACVAKAPLASEQGARKVEGGEANRFGARNVEGGEANQIGAHNVAGVATTPNRIGGENNAVYPSKTTQFVANTENCG